jgi:hypothetical protein
MQLPCWSYLFTCVIAVAALCYSAAHPAVDDLSRLEQLLHKIERAPTLSAEAIGAIERLVEEAGARAGLSEQAKAQREAVIERVLGAIQAKQAVATAGAL